MNRLLSKLSSSSRTLLKARTFRSYSTSYIADDVDPNDNFDWLTKRSTKKVTSINDLLASQKQKEIELNNNNKDSNSDKSVINNQDDSLRNEFNRASLESNQPIDRSNLTISTLVRVCGKLNTQQEKHEHIIKRLETIANKESTTTTTEKQPSIEITLNHCHQLMRELIDRSQIDLVEHLFNMLTISKDTSIEILNLNIQQNNNNLDTNNINNNKNKVNEKKLVIPDIIAKYVKATANTYKLMLEAYSNVGSLDKCMEIIDVMKSKHLIIDSETYLIVIRGYTLANRPDDALAYFNRKVLPLNQLDTNQKRVAMNDIICCYSRLGNIEALEQSLQFMRGTSCSVDYDSYTYQHMIDAYIKSGDIRRATSLLYQMDESAMPSTTYSFHKVFEALGREGLVGQIFSIFDMMCRPEKPMIESYQVDDFYQRAEPKITSDWKPNINTFNVLIGSICRTQDLEKAFETFEKLQKYDLTPSSEIYSSLEALALKQNKMSLYNKYCGDQFHIIKYDLD